MNNSDYSSENYKLCGGIKQNVVSCFSENGLNGIIKVIFWGLEMVF